MASAGFFRILSAVAATAGATAYLRYRREISELREQLKAGSEIAETSAGPVEYAEKGEGQPLLLIHGAGGGYDQGLMIGRDFAEGFRVIAPSRFGYLRTPVPADTSPAAQADAHTALLDKLGVKKCVVAGVSAGGPSAIEFALRYPDRTEALLLIVPRTYDPTQSIGADKSFGSQAVLRLVETSADFLFWVGMKVARPAVVRFLGVPPELEAKAPKEERERTTEVMRNILPLSDRVAGIAVDSSAEIAPWPLEKIKAPTLVISAKDDLFGTLPGARFTAAHIPGAELEVLESGGHPMLGQRNRVNAIIGSFLKRRLRLAASRKTKATSAKHLEPA
ncbi:MAG TPA: alpha/beta hydrolase [Sphingomicrobium sp.]